MRCIFFANSRETALPYYNLLELLTLDNIYKFRVAAFAHKILIQQTDIPEIFSRCLESVSSVHSYNTRYSKNKNLVRPKVKTNYGMQTFKFSVKNLGRDSSKY